jgi:hypothetical protein
MLHLVLFFPCLLSVSQSRLSQLTFLMCTGSLQNVLQGGLVLMFSHD